MVDAPDFRLLKKFTKKLPHLTSRRVGKRVLMDAVKRTRISVTFNNIRGGSMIRFFKMGTVESDQQENNQECCLIFCFVETVVLA
jgi:hypothetical protein